MFEVTQIAVGGFDHNFSYVIHDSETGDTAVVDPCGDVSKIRDALEKYPDRKPRYILITHGHTDHTSGLAEVRKFFPAPTVTHPVCRIFSDIPLKDREKLPFGKSYIQAFFTPGHSVSSVCWLLGDNSAVFTGDTLFVGCCGYCHPETMFQTMREVISRLPDEAVVYSGHDYGEEPYDTLGHQKQVNPFLYLTDLQDFKEAVKDL